MNKQVITINDFEFSYFPCDQGSDKCMILILASSSDTNFIVKPAVKYFHELGINMVAFMPALKGEIYSGWKDFPLDKLGDTIDYVLAHGNKKVGLAGASATSIASLTGAVLFEKVSLVVVMAVMDYVMQGSHIKTKKSDPYKEWPAVNTSMFTYKGQQIPYSPYNLDNEAFNDLAWGQFKLGDFNILPMMDWIEQQKEFSQGLIPVEKAHAKIVMFGADNDTGCYAGNNVRRIAKRLEDANYAYGYEAHTYECCSHYIYPQKLITNLLPVGSSLLLGLMFKAERKQARECVKTRKAVDKEIRRVIQEW